MTSRTLIIALFPGGEEENAVPSFALNLTRYSSSVTDAMLALQADGATAPTTPTVPADGLASMHADMVSHAALAGLILDAAGALMLAGAAIFERARDYVEGRGTPKWDYDATD